MGKAQSAGLLVGPDASVCVRIDQTAFNISPGEGLLTGRLDQVGVIQIADSLNI